MPAWSRQVSSWGYNPVHGKTPSNSGTTTTGQSSDNFPEERSSDDLDSGSNGSEAEACNSADVPCKVPCDSFQSIPGGLRNTSLTQHGPRGMFMTPDSMPEFKSLMQRSMPGKSISLDSLPGKADSLDSLPELAWVRQDSTMSTTSAGSAAFEEMSSAFGLHCHIKNTFLDVDAVDRQKKPMRKTRSVTPPRQQAYDPAEEIFEPEGCFMRQPTK